MIKKSKSREEDQQPKANSWFSILRKGFKVFRDKEKAITLLKIAWGLLFVFIKIVGVPFALIYVSFYTGHYILGSIMLIFYLGIFLADDGLWRWVRRKKKLLGPICGIIIVVTGILIYRYTRGQPPDWKSLGGDNKVAIYYDAKNISYPSKGIIRVWIKSVFSDEGKRELISTGRTIGNSMKGYEELDYMKMLIEINCLTETSRTIKGYSYGKDGKPMKFIKGPDWGKLQVISSNSVLKEIMKTYYPQKEDWKYYSTCKDGRRYYYDARNIFRTQENIIRVKTKWVYTDEERTKLIRSREKDGLSTWGFKNLSHMIMLTEINCSDYYFRTLEFTHYGKEEEILESIKIPEEEAEWNDYPPGATEEALHDEVCK